MSVSDLKLSLWKQQHLQILHRKQMPLYQDLLDEVCRNKAANRREITHYTLNEDFLLQQYCVFVK